MLIQATGRPSALIEATRFITPASMLPNMSTCSLRPVLELLITWLRTRKQVVAPFGSLAEWPQINLVRGANLTTVSAIGPSGHPNPVKFGLRCAGGLTPPLYLQPGSPCPTSRFHRTQVCEVSRRAGDHHAAQFREPRLHFGLRQADVDFLIELVDDRDGSFFR